MVKSDKSGLGVQGINVVVGRPIGYKLIVVGKIGYMDLSHRTECLRNSKWGKVMCQEWIFL